MLTVTGVDKNIFLKSKSVKMLPMVSAEWNQNIFNPPYITVAGIGTAETLGSQTGKTITALASNNANKHPNFNTNSFTMTGTNDYVQYSITTANSKTAYKIITYVTTDGSNPVMINTYAQGADRQFGSNNAEANSYGWTKIETYIGANSSIASFTYKIIASLFSSDSTYPNIYYTTPEIYETTQFDYQNGPIWPTDIPFAGFRPGESYVCTGNSTYNLGTGSDAFPDIYRNVTNTNLLKGYASTFKMPVSPIASTPSFIYMSSPIPIYKHGLMTDISEYKYFISDNITGTNSSISALYSGNVLVNKLVLKFNTYLSIPTVTVTITKTDGTTITSTSNVPDDNGTLILYLNSSQFNTTRWSTMPQFNSSGDITNYVNIKKITVTQTATTPRSTLGTITNTNVIDNYQRMSLVEVSPRLEVDLTSYTMDLTVNKALDSKDTYMPISSIVTDDASITLSSIPLGNIGTPIPIFSNTSNYSSTKLSGLLKKNIKFYINYKVVDYADWTTGTDTTINKVIPGGVFYSDSWQQNDIDTVKIQCYDVTRYLQSTPACDYVAQHKDAFSVISNMLDLSGFTDYDVDSLYSVCNDNSTPITMDYYYCNSKDTTLVDALHQIFLPYQIGAYIDNFGVMKFLSLSNIMKSASSSTNFDFDASSVIQNGYQITNKAKPGKISLRYTAPRIKQSLSIQNVTNADIKVSPSYIYTTSNDVVWEQQNVDSVGLNYLNSTLDASSNSFSINQSDLLDSFHTFNLNNNGFVVLEDEIISFVYKEYTISQTSSPGTSRTVSVKNDIELSAQVDKFIKDKQIGLRPSVGVLTNATSTTVSGLSYTTYTFTGSATSDVPSPVTTISVGDLVSVTNMNPETLNVSATVTGVSGNTFTLVSGSTDAMSSGWTGGRFTKGLDYDVTVTPTGKITNINRGMFGTNASAHSVIDTTITSNVITSKDIKISLMTTGNAITNPSNNASIDGTNKSILVGPDLSSKVLLYPNTAVEQSYSTYSGKFYFSIDQKLASAGLFFNLNTSATNGTYFLELVRYDTSSTSTPNYSYALILSQVVSGTTTPIAYSNVTGVVTNIKNNFEKMYRKNPSPTKKDGSDAYLLYVDPHETFHLRFSKYPYVYKEDGEGTPSSPTGFTFSTFLNNFEITGWQTFVSNQWTKTSKNSVTGNRKRVVLPSDISTGTKFGVFFSNNPTILQSNVVGGVTTPQISYPANNATSGTTMGYAREIYASQKILNDRSVNYYFQDREFLNGLVQNQRLFTQYKEYMMQTQPVLVGINVYDVQYTNGSATSVDITYPEYYWLYYPNNGNSSLTDQRYVQVQNVDEYSISSSTVVNTGFRGKFAVVNNSTHMVYLKKDSDAFNNFVAIFNLWTHEAVVPSDPEIVEVITDPGNLNETMQIDSPFIQSRTAANKLLKIVSASLDNFSKDISVSIFGNPLVEVGDIVSLTYPLMGINQQKYVVHSVSNSYNNGLSTTLTLNMLYKGITV
jgi:hypothetical protein